MSTMRDAGGSDKENVGNETQYFQKLRRDADTAFLLKELCFVTYALLVRYAGIPLRRHASHASARRVRHWRD